MRAVDVDQIPGRVSVGAGGHLVFFDFLDPLHGGTHHALHAALYRSHAAHLYRRVHRMGREYYRFLAELLCKGDGITLDNADGTAQPTGLNTVIVITHYYASLNEDITCYKP